MANVQKTADTFQDHVLVCLSSAPSNANIIKTGAKMARAFGAKLTALYVHTPRSQQMGVEDRNRLQIHIQLAQSLGAEITTVYGDDVPYQIGEFARLAKVTKVVIGRSNVTRARPWGKKPLTERLIASAPQLEIYIIPDTLGENRRKQPAWEWEFSIPTTGQWLFTFGLLGIASLAGFLFDFLGFAQANIFTCYILSVLVSALMVRNTLCSGIAAMLAILFYDFFFVAPRYTLFLTDGGYLVTFSIILTAALVAAALAKRLAEDAQQSAESASRTKALFETTQLLQKAPDQGQILRVAASQVCKLLEREILLYVPQGDGLDQGTHFGPEGSQSFFGEQEAAQWVWKNQDHSGFGNDLFADDRGLYLSIRGSGSVYGVVGISLEQGALEPFENSVLLSILGECALAMDSSRNAREKEEAAVLAKNEQLRANLLRSISHDLRTPLTSISGNAENLMENDALLDERSRRAVLQDIYEDAIWLHRLVENLLAITRIGDGRMELHLSAQLVDEVAAEALTHIGRTNHSHHVDVELGDDLLLGQMDPRLISQVMVNLVENAIKYTPDGSRILLSAFREEGWIHILVSDTGPGIPDSQKDKVFDMFYTGKTAVADCRRSLGLGLALCRSIVNAHGGEITLRDNVPQGCIFEFTLPASEVTLNE